MNQILFSVYVCLGASVEGTGHCDFSNSGTKEVRAYNPSSLEKMGMLREPCPPPTHPLTLPLYSGSPGFRFQTLTANTSLPELMEMQPLLAYHSRLPLGFTFWQDLCRGRTMELYFSPPLLTQAGCVYILPVSVYITTPPPEPDITTERTCCSLPARPPLPNWVHKPKGHNYCGGVMCRNQSPCP